MFNWRSALLFLCAVLLFTASPAAEKDVAVNASNWGQVAGRIYQAATGEPVEGATVVIQDDGVFAVKGKTVAKTDKVGLYLCQAQLGRISTKFNVAGLVADALLPIGGLLGPSSTTTKRIDVTQLNVRVTREGFRPFEGVARCRRADANSFYVVLEPILLTAPESPELSTTADGWGVARILDMTVEPSILNPGQKATVTVRLASPVTASARGDSSLFSGRKVKLKLKLGLYSSFAKGLITMTMATQAEGTVTYTAAVTVPKAPKGPTHRVTAYIAESPVEIIEDGGLKSALVQIIPKGVDPKAAQLRLEIARLREEKQNSQAVEQLQALAALPEATIDDCLWLATTSALVHDYQTGLNAVRQARGLLPAKAKKVVLYGSEASLEVARWELLGRYGHALINAGQPAVVISEILPAVEKVKEKERPDKVPGAVMVAIGLAYLDQGKLAEASAINEKLLLWSDGTLTEAGREFRRKLRMAQVEAGVRAAPNSAQAWANYGRLLIDQGRWAEAVEKLRKAVELDPTMLSVRRDLTYAGLHVTGAQATDAVKLDDAIAAAEKTVNFGDAKKRSQNFYDWHSLGVLLYRKAFLQRQAKDAGEAATLKHCREILIEAIKCGRTGADIYDYWTVTTTRQIAVSGFAYPEANDDYLLLTGLDTLAKQPDDYLTWFTLSTSLLNLGQLDEADAALRECVRLNADFPETTYASAQLAIARGNPDGAIALLQEVVTANPRHPFAHKKLAQLYTESGDIVRAAACLAAHAQVYGVAE
ncbi:MAG: tetratricopeptide repeat protein [Armatimonadota bacterium]